MCRYYLTERGPSIGTQPNGFITMKDYGEKKYIEEINCKAWGYVVYSSPLSIDQIDAYELVGVVECPLIEEDKSILKEKGDKAVKAMFEDWEVRKWINLN